MWKNIRCINLVKEKLEGLKLMGTTYRKKKQSMQISGIDKDFIDIIDCLDKGGFRPFASCDGVIANHPNGEPAERAYIAFLESQNIEDLMAAFLRDEETFTVLLQNDTYRKPNYLYGNLIHGNRFSVLLDNQFGEYSSYFEKIIKGVLDKSIQVSDEERQIIHTLNSVLKQDKKSDLYFEVHINSRYQPYMKKDGKTNSLKIGTKGDVGYYKDMQQLLEELAKQNGIVIKERGCGEQFDEEEFGICTDAATCEIYFSKGGLSKIAETIKNARKIGRGLDRHKMTTQDYDYDEVEI